jgi:hypothetical protein
MKRTAILFLLSVLVVLADNQKAEKKALELQNGLFGWSMFCSPPPCWPIFGGPGY